MLASGRVELTIASSAIISTMLKFRFTSEAFTMEPGLQPAPSVN
jgi:hypothetical protein